MYSIAPGQTRQTWRPSRSPSYLRRVCTWRILGPAGAPIAEATTKYGALALIALLNALQPQQRPSGVGVLPRDSQPAEGQRTAFLQDQSSSYKQAGEVSRSRRESR